MNVAMFDPKKRRVPCNIDHSPALDEALQPHLQWFVGQLRLVSKGPKDQRFKGIILYQCRNQGRTLLTLVTKYHRVDLVVTRLILSCWPTRTFESWHVLPKCYYPEFPLEHNHKWGAQKNVRPTTYHIWKHSILCSVKYVMSTFSPIKNIRLRFVSARLDQDLRNGRK